MKTVFLSSYLILLFHVLASHSGKAEMHFSHCMTFKLMPLKYVVFIHDVVTVTGMLTNLPCNITPPVEDDNVNLVLWYKDGFGKPLFGFDLRRATDKNQPLTSPTSARAQFNPRSSPTAVLSLFGVRENDTGVYQCRVDFKRSPTRYWKVNLTVIVPPTSSVILTETGHEVLDGRVGPFDVSSSLVLTCDVLGGWPTSSVSWWRDGVLFDDSWERVSPGKSRNTMTLPHLSRADHGSELLCLGSNNNETQPIAKSVSLSLNLEPLSASIEAPNGLKSFIAGKSYDLSCKAIGGFPRTKISWFLDDLRIGLDEATTSKEDNATTSHFEYKPKESHDGKKLRCVAKNPSLTRGNGVEAAIPLKVQFAPVVSLGLGRSLKATEVQDGDDVYFECKVTANPPAMKITWMKDGKAVKPSSGVIINEFSLVLQRVSREAGGVYACVATNEIGVGSSEGVDLNVKFAPVCAKSKVPQPALGYTSDEDVKVLCQVDSNPPPINFIWKYNSTTDLLDVPLEDVLIDGSVSVASIRPKQKRFASLLCWAENELGLQRRPSVYYLMPADKPDPVANCLVSNRTFDSLMVECDHGFNGGLQQTYFADVFASNNSKSPAHKMENKHYPLFHLENLSPNTHVKVVVYAENLKGRSDETTLYGSTIEKPQRHVLDNHHFERPVVDVTPFVKFFMVIFFIISFICAAAIGFTYCARRKQRRQYAHSAAPAQRHSISHSHSGPVVVGTLEAPPRKGILVTKPRPESIVANNNKDNRRSSI